MSTFRSRGPGGVVMRRLRTGPATGRAGGPQILVIEATLVNQQVAMQMLEQAGFRAAVAQDGRAGLDALATGTYAAVLMDCQMPELDGYETTREIRRRERGATRIPIIAMTASSTKGERERCLACGMDDYLTKSLRTLELQDAMRRWVFTAARSVEPEPEPGSCELLAQSVFDELDLDGELLARLLTIYVQEAATDIAALDEALGRADAPAAARVAHKIKGTSATVGSPRVAAIAGRLETRTQAGDLAAAAALLADMRASLGEVSHAIPAAVAAVARATRR
jgi:two-component system sensor histidine kinase/response regulator